MSFNKTIYEIILQSPEKWLEYFASISLSPRKHFSQQAKSVPVSLAIFCANLAISIVLFMVLSAIFFAVFYWDVFVVRFAGQLKQVFEFTTFWVSAVAFFHICLLFLASLATFVIGKIAGSVSSPKDIITGALEVSHLEFVMVIALAFPVLLRSTLEEVIDAIRAFEYSNYVLTAALFIVASIKMLYLYCMFLSCKRAFQFDNFSSLKIAFIATPLFLYVICMSAPLFAVAASAVRNFD